MKHTLLVPIAGDGSRFVNQGYGLKPQIRLPNGFTILEHSMSSIDPESYTELIFVVQKAHNLTEWLKETWKGCEVVELEEKTDGTVESCLVVTDLKEKENPLAIYCPDVWFAPTFNLDDIDYTESSGHILTFKANSDAYSYAKVENGFVTQTREKEIISEQAAVGLYCFKSSKEFFHYAEQMIENNLRTKGEFYLCPLYNLLIEDGLKVTASEVEKMYVLGTPEEYEFICKTAFRSGYIGVVSDHSGYELKEQFKTWLKEQSVSCVDYGPWSDSPCDYSDFVPKTFNPFDTSMVFGFCRSGNGINISANRGHVASLIMDEWMAECAVRHNGAFFFSVPTKYVDLDLLKRMYKTIKQNTFDGGRHMNRLMKL